MPQALSSKNQVVMFSDFTRQFQYCSPMKRSVKTVRQNENPKKIKGKKAKLIRLSIGVNLKITLDVNNEIRYHSSMIKSFQSKETEKVFQRLFSRTLPHDIQRVAMRKLWMLDAATELNALRVPPGNHLEALHEDREGQHSIRINRQWRICFEWHEGNAYNVEIVDYH